LELYYDLRLSMSRTLLVLVFFAAPAIAAAGVTVSSPNGKVQLRLAPADPLAIEVRFRDRTIIEPSPLGITVDGVALTAGAELGKVETYEVNEKFPWNGGHAEAVNRCRGARIAVRHPASETTYTLELRAYDTGAAFRFVVPGGEKARVPDESTTFRLPAGSTVWSHDLEGHYEAVHKKAAVADVPAGQWAAPPMTVRLPDSLGYVSITEAALTNYSGMALKADGNGGFTVALGHAHPPSYPFRLRYAADVERVSKPAVITGPITTPWRVVLVGADLNALVNADVIAGLAPAPAAEMFPRGAQTEWIKPGRAVWKYLDGGSSTLDGVKEFSKLAGELGFEYQVVEGFWSRWSDDQIKDAVAYSRDRGVGLWFWRHSKELRTPQAREGFFKRLHEVGVVGAKIDFFDHEHKEVVDLYEALLREAAKYHILVNFHGANKPTGEGRTWPNELTREAVRGMEASRLTTRARHDATLPFTRFLAGPADYTPVHFGARRADTTATHQVATAVVFSGPLLTYGAHPKSLLASPAVELIKTIPAVWDETIVLPPSEVGEVAVYARRRGTTWFLAAVNGPATRSITVPLTFLGEGDYRLLEARDDAADPAAIRMGDTKADRTGSVKLDLPAGGGYVGRFTRAGS
jgi:alpha-glucosidase